MYTMRAPSGATRPLENCTRRRLVGRNLGGGTGGVGRNKVSVRQEKVVVDAGTPSGGSVLGCQKETSRAGKEGLRYGVFRL